MKNTNIPAAAVIAGTALIGETLDVKTDVCIITENGAITQILENCRQQGLEQRLRTEGFKVYDLEDAVVLPGMFDCHTHLAMDAGKSGHLMMPQKPYEQQMENALEGLRKDLMAGITTARCMGDRNGLDFELKRMIMQGEAQGPELLVCGTGMRSPNGHGFAGVAQESPEAFRKTCAQNISAGADHLKIFVTPGVPEASETEVPCYMSREEIFLVADAAKAAGIPSTAHCIGGQGLMYCMEAGVDVLDHLYSVTEQEVRELEEHFEGWIDLTSGIVLDEEREPYVPEDTARRMRLARPYTARCLERIYRSKKLKWTIGTDAYHGMLYKELEFAVSLGAGAKDALLAVTVNAAKMTRQADRKGQIAPGYQADLTAAPGNPLQDPGVLRNIIFVMQRGTVFHVQ